jgi:hypothetical protein
MNSLVSILSTLGNMTKEGQWRVRMAIIELFGELGKKFGKDDFTKHIQSIFLGYLQNTAAAVRAKGVEKSGELAKDFGE